PPLALDRLLQLAQLGIALEQGLPRRSELDLVRVRLAELRPGQGLGVTPVEQRREPRADRRTVGLEPRELVGDLADLDLQLQQLRLRRAALHPALHDGLEALQELEVVAGQREVAR